jgi:hypothetical protein
LHYLHVYTLFSPPPFSPRCSPFPPTSIQKLFCPPVLWFCRRKKKHRR